MNTMQNNIIKIRNLDAGEKQSLVKTVSQFDSNFDLMKDHSRTIIDAKSLMGVFSLDLSKGAELIVYEPSERISEALEPFMVSV